MQLQVVNTETLESELNPRQGINSFGLVPTLVLLLTKADPVTKKRGYKLSTANKLHLKSVTPAASK